MTTPEPVLSTPPPGPAVITARPRRLRWPWWSIGGMIVVGLLGGGYFAYSRGYISIPFLTPKEDQLFNRFIDSLTEINNAQYKVQIGLKSEARAAGTTSIFPSANERKAESNDTKRKSDLASIRAALALYFDDNNNKYPDSIETTLTPTYLNTLPTDPKDKSKYQYQTCDGGKHFLLKTGLESDEWYYLTDTGTANTTDTVPACGQNTNISRGLLQLLRPTAYAQATSFSIESIGGEVGLGVPESNYPFLGLLNIFGLGDLESVIDVFPSDIDTAAAITFYAEADKQLKEADALLAINGSYRGDDLTVEFDVEGRKLGSTIYGIIRKFPGIPYLSKYVSPIKNTWVKIEPGDGNPFLRADTFKQASLKSGVESVRQSLKDALDGKIVTLDKSLGTENIAGVQSSHYRVALHPDRVKAVLEKIKVDRESKKLSIDTLEDAIKQLAKPGSLASLQRLVDNSTVDVWVDKVKGYLRQISWSIALVPPDGSEKLKDKQFRLTLTLTLDKVNQKVNVGRPGDAIDYAEAERKVTGISVEQQKYSRQRSQVSAVRSALKQLFDTNKTYPESITTLDADLKQALDACKILKDQPRNTNTYTYVYCNDYLLDDGPIVVKDIYTNKPYGYSRVGDGYNLTYEMKLDFANTNTEYSYSSYYKDDYVEGKNTATSKDVSIEKQTTSEVSEKKRQEAVNANANKNINLNTNSTSTNTNTTTLNYWSQLYSCLSSAPTTSGDADNDGISDYDEIYKYAAHPCLADTDSDGYPDKTEIDGGYNPNGSGKATAEQLQLWGKSTSTSTNTNTTTSMNGSAPKFISQALHLNPGQASVYWVTDIPADGVINYGTTTAYGAINSDYPFVNNHTINFPVTAGTTYHYAIRACVATLPATTGCTTSQDYTFVAQ